MVSGSGEVAHILTNKRLSDREVIKTPPPGWCRFGWKDVLNNITSVAGNACEKQFHIYIACGTCVYVGYNRVRGRIRTIFIALTIKANERATPFFVA